jgi:tetratricopeptide (TPR) repeat protein
MKIIRNVCFTNQIILFLFRSLQYIVRAGFILLLLIFAAKAHVRNWDWETEESVFASGLRVNQRNAKLYNNVGHALESQKKYREALEYFVQAVR